MASPRLVTGANTRAPPSSGTTTTACEASWTFANDRGGWRLDHVLVHGLRPLAGAYAHDWRRAGLSDHSALVVDLV